MEKERHDEDVKKAARQIRAALKRAGKWSAEMELQVEALASDIVVYRRLRDDIMQNGVMMEEISREGDARARLRPSVGVFRQYSDALRADLKVLLMNRVLDPGAPAGGGLLEQLMEGG